MVIGGRGRRVSVRDADALVFLGYVVGTNVPLPFGIALLVGAVLMFRAADPAFHHLGFIAVSVGGVLTATGGVALVAGGWTPTPNRVLSLLAWMAMAGVLWLGLRLAVTAGNNTRGWPGGRGERTEGPR